MKILIAFVCIFTFVVLSSPTDDWKNKRIIIVGGGMGGISAADKLINQYGFKNITILEGQWRMGGRIYPVEFEGQWIQIGAQFLHNPHSHIYQVGERLDLVPKEGEIQDKKRAVFLPGGHELPEPLHDKLSKYADLDYSHQEGGYTEESKKNYVKTSIGDEEDKIFKSYLKNLTLTPEEKKIADALYEYYTIELAGTNANHDLHKLSLRSIFNISGVPPTTDRDKVYTTAMRQPGYQKILQWFLSKIPNTYIHLNSSVTNIDYTGKEDPVVVTVQDGKKFHGDHVIVAVPVGHLKKHMDTLFTPPVPAKKKTAIQSLGFDNLAKVTMIFHRDDNFWPTQTGYVAFVKVNKTAEEDKDLSDIFYGIVLDPWNNTRVLFWVHGGPDVDQMEAATEQQLADAGVKALKKFTNFKNIKPPVKVIRSQWKSNPHVGGAYSYLSTENDKTNTSNTDIAEPIMVNVKGKQTPVVMFAGECTHQTKSSMVHGAFETGDREADRIATFYGIKVQDAILPKQQGQKVEPEDQIHYSHQGHIRVGNETAPPTNTRRRR